MAEEKLYNLFYLNDYFDNDQKAIVPILKMYLEETPKELANIENCLMRNDVAASKAATHKIKTNVSMLSIRDKSSFINDMHLHPATGNIHSSIKEQFEIFKATVTAALHEISTDFSFNDDAEWETGSTRINQIELD